MANLSVTHIVWEGSALNCENGVTITLSALNNYVVMQCNNGPVVGEVISIGENNLTISHLTIAIAGNSGGKSVQCIADTGLPMGDVANLIYEVVISKSKSVHIAIILISHPPRTLL